MAEGAKGKGAAIVITIVAAVFVVAFGLVVVLMRNSPPTAPAPLVGPQGVTATPGSEQMAQPAEAGQVDPSQPPSTPLPPDPGTASANVDGALSFSDDSLAFSAAVPAGAANDPVLAYLRRSNENYLAKMKPAAREAKRTGAAAAEPWDVKVKWDYTAKSGDIVSLSGIASEYTGGAHPMQYFDTHIARVRTGEQLKFDDLLLASRKPSPALVIAICEALKAAKTARINAATINSEPIVCAGSASNVNIEEAHIALAPSNQAGKFGGAYVYYDPYKVGAYSEGAYKLTVQQEVFAEDLRPEFKPFFAGEAPVLRN